jgi:hypothetical protein
MGEVYKACKTKHVSGPPCFPCFLIDRTLLSRYCYQFYTEPQIDWGLDYLYWHVTVLRCFNMSPVENPLHSNFHGFEPGMIECREKNSASTKHCAISAWIIWRVTVEETWQPCKKSWEYRNNPSDHNLN